MEQACSSETLVSVHETTIRHNLGQNLNRHDHENLKNSQNYFPRVSLPSLYAFDSKQFIRNTQHILLQIIMNFRTTMVHTLE